MITLELKQKNIRNANLNMAEFVKRIEQEAGRALIASTREVFNKAQSDVPVDSGELKRSGDYTRNLTDTNSSGSGNSNNEITTAIYYTADHAVYPHEMPGGEGYKWLESAVNSKKINIKQNIRQGAIRGMRKASEANRRRAK